MNNNKNNNNNNTVMHFSPACMISMNKGQVLMITAASNSLDRQQRVLYLVSMIETQVEILRTVPTSFKLDLIRISQIK